MHFVQPFGYQETTAESGRQAETWNSGAAAYVGDDGQLHITLHVRYQERDGRGVVRDTSREDYQRDWLVMPLQTWQDLADEVTGAMIEAIDRNRELSD